MILHQKRVVYDKAQVQVSIAYTNFSLQLQTFSQNTTHTPSTLNEQS